MALCLTNKNLVIDGARFKITRVPAEIIKSIASYLFDIHVPENLDCLPLIFLEPLYIATPYISSAMSFRTHVLENICLLHFEGPPKGKA